MRILVVDDDRAVRESLRRSLTFNGYTVDLAVDGLDALERNRRDARHHVECPQIPLNANRRAR